MGEPLGALEASSRCSIASTSPSSRGRHIRELSGGQQQRIFVARALLGRPELLLLDEPTSGVDARIRHEILHLLGDLAQAGLTIVLTTHDLNGIATHLPRLVCLNRRVIGLGPPAEVLTPDDARAHVRREHGRARPPRCLRRRRPAVPAPRSGRERMHDHVGVA